jgi:hypothetical protein
MATALAAAALLGGGSAAWPRRCCWEEVPLYGRGGAAALLTTLYGRDGPTGWRHRWIVGGAVWRHRWAEATLHGSGDFAEWRWRCMAAATSLGGGNTIVLALLHGGTTWWRWMAAAARLGGGSTGLMILWLFSEIAKKGPVPISFDSPRMPLGPPVLTHQGPIREGPTWIG